MEYLEALHALSVLHATFKGQGEHDSTPITVGMLESACLRISHQLVEAEVKGESPPDPGEDTDDAPSSQVTKTGSPDSI